MTMPNRRLPPSAAAAAAQRSVPLAHVAGVCARGSSAAVKLAAARARSGRVACAARWRATREHSRAMMTSAPKATHAARMRSSSVATTAAEQRSAAQRRPHVRQQTVPPRRRASCRAGAARGSVRRTRTQPAERRGLARLLPRVLRRQQCRVRAVSAPLPRPQDPTLPRAPGSWACRRSAPAACLETAWTPSAQGLRPARTPGAAGDAAGGAAAAPPARRAATRVSSRARQGGLGERSHDESAAPRTPLDAAMRY
jgi:hypothetical protein